MIDYAYQNGNNYFDTAWGYHNGNSELVVGKYLGRYPRESYYFASKFPGYDLSNMDKVEEIFERQLEKCRTINLVDVETKRGGLPCMSQPVTTAPAIVPGNFLFRS